MGAMLVPLMIAAAFPDLALLDTMTARFAPTEIRVDTSSLTPGDHRALGKLVEASRLIDDIFLTQVWSGNHALYARLKRDATPLGKARLEYFWINKSPWSALDGNTAFLPGVPPRKLPGANFYPEDMTRDEFEAWIKTLAPPPVGGPKDFSRRSAAVPRATSRRCRTAASTTRRWSMRQRCCAQAAALTSKPDPAEVPELARRRLSVQRLLFQRHGLDGPGCATRHHHRPLRDL